MSGPHEPALPFIYLNPHRVKMTSKRGMGRGDVYKHYILGVRVERSPPVKPQAEVRGWLRT